jgi:plasmid maintenance system antidote protein VapI
MDVMDDPHFEPMYGRTRGELLAADARELFQYGVRIEQVAERLGVTRNHIQQELLRHPDTEKAAA